MHPGVNQTCQWGMAPLVKMAFLFPCVSGKQYERHAELIRKLSLAAEGCYLGLCCLTTTKTWSKSQLGFFFVKLHVVPMLTSFCLHNHRPQHISIHKPMEMKFWKKSFRKPDIILHIDWPPQSPVLHPVWWRRQWKSPTLKPSLK